MKIICPKCREVLPAEQVNISTDMALCPGCNEGFKVSESVDLDSINDNYLRDPPRGAWFREEMEGATVGASTRSAIGLFLVPFACVWSGGALGGIYGSQIGSGEFDPMASLIGIPFLIGSFFLWAMTLMAVCGKVEVRIRGGESAVFVGVGKIGWTRRFDWTTVQVIREAPNNIGYPGGYFGGIFMEGRERVKFGTNLNEKRRYYMLNVLKYLKAHGSAGAASRGGWM